VRSHLSPTERVELLKLEKKVAEQEKDLAISRKERRTSQQIHQSRAVRADGDRVAQFRDLLPWQGYTKCQDQAITAGWLIKACSRQKANAMRARTEEIMAIRPRLQGHLWCSAYHCRAGRKGPIGQPQHLCPKSWLTWDLDDISERTFKIKTTIANQGVSVSS